MWRCKECGGTEFCVEFDETLRVEIYKNGRVKPINPLEYEVYYYECCDCGNCAEDIKEIADWIETEEE